MFRYVPAFFLVFSYISPLYAQPPVFSMDSLHVVYGAGGILSKKDIGATVRLYSTAEALVLHIRVIDDHVEWNPGTYYTDHVEIRFALPPSAYPDNFPYQLHPDYVISAPPLRGGLAVSGGYRFFSLASRQAQSIGPGELQSRYNYPSADQIRRDSLRLPPPSELRKARLDFGINHFGLFPDQRPAVQYNSQNQQVLAKSMGVSFGDFAQGIKYTIDQHDDGYTVHAQISPTALGFVQLPSMQEICIGVEVIDTDYRITRGHTVLSTSPLGGERTPEDTYKKVRLPYPLKTNFTQAPDRVFQQTGYRPLSVFTQTGWVYASVDVDAMPYRREWVNNNINELRFLTQPTQYSAWYDNQRQLGIERLTVNSRFAHALGQTTEYILINGLMLKSQRTRKQLLLLDDSTNTIKTFNFPDGAIGVILTENFTYNPYGWGRCGNCLEERVRVIRLENGTPKEIVKIDQNEGSPPFCQIGPLPFNDFYVSRINWLKAGQKLVLQLNARNSSQRKRVSVSWNDNGSKVEVAPIP